MLHDHGQDFVTTEDLLQHLYLVLILFLGLVDPLLGPFRRSIRGCRAFQIEGGELLEYSLWYPFLKQSDF